MTRPLILLIALVAGCDVPSAEEKIRHCHDNGYSAQTQFGKILCCSVLNGDDLCLRTYEVTRHRRETGQ